MSKIKNPYHISQFYKIFSGQTISQPVQKPIQQKQKQTQKKPIQQKK